MKITDNKYSFLKPADLTPTGWLYNQLKTEADGLSGNLDKIWPDVRDSRWIGGSCEGWERVPYWLDGFVPLAYLLRDDDRIARAKKYIDAILAGQCEDGWICPCDFYPSTASKPIKSKSLSVLTPLGVMMTLSS